MSPGAFNTSGLSQSGPVAECEVERIIDGDTIHCEPVGRIRLIGMDTPERGQKPFGPAATAALTEMTPIGSLIEVEFDVERTDRYDRILGYLWANGELVNWQLVREGWALIAIYPPNVRYSEHFLQAQQDARGEGVGLWAVDGFDCEPSASPIPSKAHVPRSSGLSVQTGHGNSFLYFSVSGLSSLINKRFIKSTHAWISLLFSLEPNTRSRGTSQFIFMNVSRSLV